MAESAPVSTPTPTPAPDTAALARLLHPIRGRLAAGVAAEVVSAIAAVVPFAAVAELGAILLAPGPIDAGAAWLVAWTAVAALGVRLLFMLIAGSITHFADVDFQLHVRRGLAERLGRVPLGWFGGRNSGEVKKAVQDDVSTMHQLVAHSLLDLTAGVVTPLTALGYLIWVDWRMALVTLLPLLAGLVLFRRTMGDYSEKMVEYDQALGRVNGSAVEFVQGIAVVRAFGQTGRAHRRFLDAADSFSRFFLGWVRAVARSSALSEVVLSPVVVVLVVLVGGAVFVVGGWLPAVDVLPFALLGVSLTSPMLQLNYTANQLRTARMAAERVAGLLGSPTQAEGTSSERPREGTVVFDHVDFSYDGDTPVLSDVSLELRPGTITALVGPSGAGKSTAAKLLPRFWDVTGGAIRIGGTDIRELPARELYRRIGFVFQDVRLLRTTVADNIRLACPDAGMETVLAAAQAAQIHDVIERLPRGYDSVVGEDARFSGGEAQRVSIARALLADTPILVLDEATAFADPESEAAIQTALSRLIAGRTLLVIAHRLATVAGADQIVVLDGGRIVERGRHDDLLAAGGLYARLWAANERSASWHAPATSETGNLR